MATANRKTARGALATLLTSGLVGTGLPCKAVFAYRPAIDRIQALQTPFVFITSASTGDDFGHAVLQDTTFAYDIHSIVLYSDGASWNEDDAEDALDDIEAIVRSTVNANRSTANWNHLTYSGDTNAADLDFDLGGLTYRHEIIRVAARYQGNR